PLRRTPRDVPRLARLSRAPARGGPGTRAVVPRAREGGAQRGDGLRRGRGGARAAQPRHHAGDPRARGDADGAFRRSSDVETRRRVTRAAPGHPGAVTTFRATNDSQGIVRAPREVLWETL